MDRSHASEPPRPTSRQSIEQPGRWSGWESWLAAHLRIHDQQLVDGFGKGMADFVHVRLEPLRSEIKRMKREIAALKRASKDNAK